MQEDDDEPFRTRLAERVRGSIVRTNGGNSGRIFIVEHKGNTYPKRVAYKTLKNAADPEKVGHFLREISVWFKLGGHSLLATPLQAERIGGVPVIATVYGDSDLAEHLLKGKRTIIPR